MSLGWHILDCRSYPPRICITMLLLQSNELSHRLNNMRGNTLRGHRKAHRLYDKSSSVDPSTLLFIMAPSMLYTLKSRYSTSHRWEQYWHQEKFATIFNWSLIWPLQQEGVVAREVLRWRTSRHVRCWIIVSSWWIGVCTVQEYSSKPMVASTIRSKPFL